MLPSLKELILNSDIHCFWGEKLDDKTRNGSSQDFCNSLINAQTETDLHEICADIRNNFGFDFFSIYASFTDKNNARLTYFMRDFASAWTEHYQKQGLLLIDPSLPYALSRVTPAIWTLGKYDDIFSPEQKKVEYQADDFGIKKLLVFPVCRGDGSHAVIRFVSTLAKYKHLLANTASHDMMHLQFLALHIFEALDRVRSVKTAAVGCHPINSTTPLSEREAEILKWVAAGKTSCETGKILSISENTVLKHLKNIYKKMDVHTRQHAVAKAVANKWISLA